MLDLISADFFMRYFMLGFCKLEVAVTVDRMEGARIMTDINRETKNKSRG